MVEEDFSDVVQALRDVLSFGFAHRFDRAVLLDEFQAGFGSNAFHAGMVIGADHDGKVHELLATQFVGCQHALQVDRFGMDHSTVALRPIVHHVAHQHGCSVEQGIPILGCHHVQLPFGRHHRCLGFPLCRCRDPRDTHQVEQLLGFLHHLRRVVHDACRHFLCQCEIAGFECFLVHGLCFQPSFTSSRHLVRFEFGRGAVEHVDRVDAVLQQRGRPMEETHEVRHRIAVLVAKRHAVTLR